MGQDASVFLADLSSYVVVVPLLVGTYRLYQLRQVQQRLYIFLLVSVLVEILAHMLRYWELGNLPLLHVFTLVQLLLIVHIYRDHLAALVSQRVLWIGSVLFTAFVIYNGLWLDGWENFNPHARAVESILVLSIIISYFFVLLRDMQVGSLEGDPLFWISSALLIYFSGSLLIFVVSQYISSSQEVMLTVWGIHAILNIVANLIYAVALWLKTQK